MRIRYIESTPYLGLKNATHLDIEVYYSKGGKSRRGFYVSVTPVTRRGDGLMSFDLFSGVARLLMEANRYSEKQHNQAIEMSREITPDLIKHVLEKEMAA